MLYKDYLNCIMTIGIKEFCEQHKCFWIFTDVVSVAMNIFLHKEDFLLIKVVKNENGKGCSIIYDDGDYHELYKQDYEYTDFNLNKFEFYLCFNEIGTYTAMLKEEY